MRSAQISTTSPLITVISRAVFKAGRSLIRDFGELEHIKVSRKGPRDFVTNADINAENILIEELRSARPSFGFLTEEQAEIQGTDPTCRWIIDPLDGTHNYLHGFPYWVISVALEKAGEIVAAAVYDPLRNELFHAERGRGAYLNNQRLRIKNRLDLGETLVATSRIPFTKLAPLVARTTGVRETGAAALNLAYTASGRFDAYVSGPLAPWDIAAGILLVRESGGIVTDMIGGQNLESSLVATNASLHEQLLAIKLLP